MQSLSTTHWSILQLEECGIDVVSKVETTLNRDDAQKFYEQHQGTDFFLQLIDYMTRSDNCFLSTKPIFAVQNLPIKLFVVSPKNRAHIIMLSQKYGYKIHELFSIVPKFQPSIFFGLKAADGVYGILNVILHLQRTDNSACSCC